MQENDTKTLTLDENLSVKAAAPLCNALCKHTGHALVINAAAVKHLDAPCAQLLLAAKNSSAVADTSFEIVDPSASFLENLDTLGLTALLSPKSELSHVS